jgi:hypothetical protein
MDIVLNLLFFIFVGNQIFVNLPNLDENTGSRYGVLFALAFAIIATSIITIHSLLIVMLIAYYLIMIWFDSLDEAEWTRIE